MIDTLKLARDLRDRGGFTQEAAEATAEALNTALGAEVATRRDVTDLGTATKLELRLIKWVVGVGIASTLAVGGMIWTATHVLLRALSHG